jgi:hypothetical protein
MAMVPGGEETQLTFGRAAVVVTRREPDVVVRISGEVDISNADMIEEAIQRSIQIPVT